ncbi:MAG: type II toxin-antitoxin system YafQ family toxin [Fibromonadaceae bacterium]|jgi:mRNA interferase YafQ|nr:type II toxin-antitoxin system YafQ family toxin [Fibromonadaceae bacterium]
MLDFETTTRYRKDVKLMRKQGKNLVLLDSIVDKLRNREVLDPKYRDHPLLGNYVGHRECHITPDWLLIYYVDNEALILTAVRTGSHSELF